MIKGTTKSGFSFEINEEVLDDIELFEMIGSIMDDEINVLQIGKIITKILGKEGKKKLYDYLRTKDGRVPASKINNEIQDIFASVNQVKN